MSELVLPYYGAHPSWAEVERTIEEKPFWNVKAKGDGETVWNQKVTGLVRAVIDFTRIRDASIDKSVPPSAVEAPSGAADVLERVLLKVCSRAGEVTCVVETSHLDDVHSNLTSGVYSHENFVASKLTVRVSVFSCYLDEDVYADSPGFYRAWETTLQERQKCKGEEGFLQDHFVGTMVIVPRRGGTSGRTLLDPSWLVPTDVSVRLTDFEQTVRGKRLSVQAWPWRQQDGEALSCAEATLLGITSTGIRSCREPAFLRAPHAWRTARSRARGYHFDDLGSRVAGSAPLPTNMYVH